MPPVLAPPFVLDGLIVIVAPPKSIRARQTDTIVDKIDDFISEQKRLVEADDISIDGLIAVRFNTVARIVNGQINRLCGGIIKG